MSLVAGLRNLFKDPIEPIVAVVTTEAEAEKLMADVPEKTRTEQAELTKLFTKKNDDQSIGANVTVLRAQLQILFLNPKNP